MESEELYLVDMTEDKRPPARPRRHARLWQSYLWWRELMLMRQRHTLRIVASERGKSQMDADFERTMMETIGLDAALEDVRKTMISAGHELGPVWEWVTAIKGLGAGGLAAQLLALIDDIALCDTVSALWRYAGLGVVDGHAEKNARGEKAHFNARLKGVCYNIAVSFIKAQTPLYVDIYYEEKRRQRALHPEPEKVNGKNAFSDAHIHNRAWRKMVKIFLQHLWVTWRRAEGLPVSEPYAQAVLHHVHIVEPALL
jgi:hypothetical protein